MLYNISRLFINENVDDRQVWYNNKGYIAVTAYNSIMNNAILRMGVGENASKYGIVTINHPLNQSRQRIKMQASLA